MMPDLILEHLVNNSAYDKVAKWIYEGTVADNRDDVTLGQLFPNSFMCSYPHLNEISSRLSERNKSDREEIENKTRELHRIVAEVLDGNEFRLTGFNFTDAEKEQIVDSLSFNGFNVTLSDFWDIILVAKAVRNGKHWIEKRIDPSLKYHYASLNCFDFDQLNREMKLLADIITYNELEDYCNTLWNIYHRIDFTDPAYPGRHLPYNKAVGRTAWTYQCLRMMDEILCRSDEFIIDDMMIQAIRGKTEELGIEFKGLSKASLKHHYVTLAELIGVEYNGGERMKYDRGTVYETGVRDGHLYKKYKGDRRLCAFAVDITMAEIFNLRKEVGSVRAEFFNDDYLLFRKKFPLLSSMGNLEDELMDADSSEDLLNPVKRTVYVTINYNISELKREAKKLLKQKLPFSIYIDGRWTAHYPLKLQSRGKQWSLIAKDLSTDKLRVITPDVIQRSLAASQGNPDAVSAGDAELAGDSTGYPDCIIGVGELRDDHVIDATLYVTEDGSEDICDKRSAFSVLNPVSIKASPGDYTSSNYFNVTFKVYINDDLLAELYRLDCAGKLVRVEGPRKLADAYEAYFRKVHGSNRVPYEERPHASPRLRRRPAAE